MFYSIVYSGLRMNSWSIWRTGRLRCLLVLVSPKVSRTLWCFQKKLYTVCVWVVSNGYSYFVLLTLHFYLTIVYSFIELAKSLLHPDGSRFLLSERFTQDPLEAFFGKQRARGGRSDNPTVKRFVENTQAIRVSRSLALGGSRVSSAP